MRDILRRRHAHVINISIRHATQDPGSLLAGACTEVFAFVIYYMQGTNEAAKKPSLLGRGSSLTRHLSSGESYYLPYQILATEDQSLRAYPRAHEFFALKRQLDPTSMVSAQ